MKTFLFLIVVILVVSALLWKMRKSQAEEELARRKSLELKKQKQKEAVTSEEVMIWPVIIKPVKGGESSGAEAKAAKPEMTAIEYEPPERLAG